MSVNERRIVAGEKQHHPRDLIGRSTSAEGNLGRQRALHDGRGLSGVHLLDDPRIGGARADRVHANPLLRELPPSAQEIEGLPSTRSGRSSPAFQGAG
jgi:hypothetical protein